MSRSNILYRLEYCISVTSAPDWYLTLFKSCWWKIPQIPPNSLPCNLRRRRTPLWIQIKNRGGCWREKRRRSKTIKSNAGLVDVPAFNMPQFHRCQMYACQLQACFSNCLLWKCFVLADFITEKLIDAIKKPPFCLSVLLWWKDRWHDDSSEPESSQTFLVMRARPVWPPPQLSTQLLCLPAVELLSSWPLAPWASPASSASFYPQTFACFIFFWVLKVNL